MGAPSRYVVDLEWSAERELDELRAFDARSIVRAIWALESEAETVTRHRKPWRKPIAGLPGASWEVRVGDYRVLYDVKKDRRVSVLRVIFKGRMAMEEAAADRDDHEQVLHNQQS